MIVVSKDVVLSVGDVLASSEPADVLEFVPLLGPEAGLHADLVETRGFGEVEDVELDPVDLLVCPDCDVLVDDLEVVPLVVALGVEVVLQPQVVLNVVHLRGFSQIAVFEATVEDQHILLLRHVDFELRVGEVSLGLELGQVHVYLLVAEELLVDGLALLFGEHRVGVHLELLLGLEVVHDLGAASETGIRVVHDVAIHFEATFGLLRLGQLDLI
jgi:hypothetical protein